MRGLSSISHFIPWDHSNFEKINASLSKTGATQTSQICCVPAYQFTAQHLNLLWALKKKEEGAG